MKNFWILFISCQLWTSHVRAQDTLMLYQAYTAFSDPEKAEWTSFQNDWKYFDYTALKEKHRIKSLNCRNCESFFAEIYLEIDESGKVANSATLRASRCGLRTSNKQLFRDFENSVAKHHFTSLKNKRFIARFGLVLKC